jgi:hypothetical protein
MRGGFCPLELSAHAGSMDNATVNIPLRNRRKNEIENHRRRHLVANVCNALIFFIPRFVTTERNQHSIRDLVRRVPFDREAVLHFERAGL